MYLFFRTSHSIRQLIEPRGYDFEDWNWPVIRFSFLVVFLAVMASLLIAVVAITVEGRYSCIGRFAWWQGGRLKWFSLRNNLNSYGS